MRLASRLLFGVALAAIAIACGDPTHSNAVDALGDDPNGIPNGPTHRAGQPCLVCHGGSGPGSPQFAIAGTVYATESAKTPLVGGTVHLTDAQNGTLDVVTNEVGNFYVYASDYAPIFPLHVTVAKDGAEADMTTHIAREGSCNACHTADIGPRSPGRAYLSPDDDDSDDGGSP
ncbi:MAG TPA: hypothetical protein VF407_20910 [Polyangiaceae bacterium]